MSAQRKSPSSLYKRTPVTGDTPPPVLEDRGPKIPASFAKAEIALICDRRINRTGSLAVLLFIRLKSFRGPVELSYPEIAQALRFGWRQVMRNVAQLADLGLIRMDRAGAGRNRYTAIMPEVQTISTPEARALGGRKLVECPRCLKRRRSLLKVGYCRTCRTEEKTRQIAREEVAAVSLPAVADSDVPWM